MIFPIIGAVWGLFSAFADKLPMKGSWVFSADSGFYGLYVTAALLIFTLKMTSIEKIKCTVKLLVTSGVAFCIAQFCKGMSLDSLLSHGFAYLLFSGACATLCYIADKTSMKFLSVGIKAAAMLYVGYEILDLFVMFTHNGAGSVPLLTEGSAAAFCLFRLLHGSSEEDDEDVVGEEDEEIPMLTEDEQWLL